MTQSLALETARYVTTALRNDEPKLAEDAVIEEGNGLTKPQQDAILALIQKRGEESNNALDRVRIDNEIWGVVNPATSQFMKTPRVLANLFLYCASAKVPNRWKHIVNPTRAFLVYDNANNLITMIPKEREESKIRMMKGQTTLGLYEFLQDIKRKKITYEQGMSYFPNLQRLVLDANMERDMSELALAIQAKCPHFTTLETDWNFLSSDFLPFKEFLREVVFRSHTRITAEEITQILGSFKRLESLEMGQCSLELLQAVAKLPIKRLKVVNWVCPLQTQVSELKQSQLEAFNIFNRWYVIQDQVIEDLKKIKSLRYLVLNAFASHSELLRLAKIPQLKILDNRDNFSELDLQQVIDILNANRNIQHIIVRSQNISELKRKRDVSQILTQYPQIIIDDSPWVTFDKKLLEQTRSSP